MKSSTRSTSRKTPSKARTNPLQRAMRLVKGALSHEQTATELLKTQHEEVKTLFKKIEKANTRAAKTKLFDQLAASLAAHDAIEREIFYPACEKAMGMTDLLGEALVEHGVVEFSLYQADEARRDASFSFKCQVLSEIVEHHVKEEEEDFFPKVERALGREKLIELAARMKERFEAAQASSFRPPLHSNLKQVLAGALKPVKKDPPRSGRKSAALGQAVKRRRAA
ncbi:MAG: hemerythrin domain-containing protein [Polyangiaceae bacterium]